jgi:hypothetical protein
MGLLLWGVHALCEPVQVFIHARHFSGRQAAVFSHCTLCFMQFAVPETLCRRVLEGAEEHSEDTDTYWRS